jgi:hypothetical protein
MAMLRGENFGKNLVLSKKIKGVVGERGSSARSYKRLRGLEYTDRAIPRRHDVRDGGEGGAKLEGSGIEWGRDGRVRVLLVPKFLSF